MYCININHHKLHMGYETMSFISAYAQIPISYYNSRKFEHCDTHSASLSLIL
jgi:hypothetical protein